MSERMRVCWVLAWLLLSCANCKVLLSTRAVVVNQGSCLNYFEETLNAKLKG